MSKKPVADLGGLVTLDPPAKPVDESHTLAPKAAAAAGKPRKPATVRLKKAGFLIHPKSLQQFDMLRAELAGDDRRNAGPKLMHEALNLLFEKHGKPLVSLDF
jgi:hypothetical protein